MYLPNWQALPNLAIDLMLPALFTCLSPLTSGRIVLVAAVLSPLCGALVFHYALFRRCSLWPLASTVVALNCAFLLGLLNFLFGIAAAFAVAAAWYWWSERHIVAGLLLVAFGSVVVFFCHLTALLLLAILIGTGEIERWWRSPAGHGGDFLRRLSLLAATAVPAFWLYLRSPTRQAAGELEWVPLSKAFFALGPVMNYDLGLDFATVSALLFLLGFGLKRRWLVMPPRIAMALALLLVLYVSAPFRIKGAAFFDMRFVVMAGYLAFAGLRENVPAMGRRVRAAILAGLLLCVAARTAVVLGVWREQNQELALMKDAVNRVPPGSRVLVATAFPDGGNPYWRSAPAVRFIDGVFLANYELPAFFLAEKRAFFQALFADPTQQPIAVREPFRASTVTSAAFGPPRYELLASGAQTLPDQKRYPYLEDWPSRFDYVLVVNAGGMEDAAGFLPDRLETEAFNDLAALFRIRR
jgi:hypothetical protein